MSGLRFGHSLGPHSWVSADASPAALALAVVAVVLYGLAWLVVVEARAWIAANGRPARLPVLSAIRTSEAHGDPRGENPFRWALLAVEAGWL